MRPAASHPTAEFDHHSSLLAVDLLPPRRSAPPQQSMLKARACGLAAFLLLLCAAVAHGQLTVLPTPGKAVGFVSAPEAGKWIVISAGEFLPVPCTAVDGGKAIVFEAPPGKYGIFFFPPGDAQPIVQVVMLGKVDPGPDPTPVPPGTRHAVVWEQSEQRTPAQAALYVNLRKQYDKTRLMILDVDQLSPAWEAYRKLANPQTLPALAVYADSKLVRVVPLPSSVDGVIVEVAR